MDAQIRAELSKSLVAYFNAKNHDKIAGEFGITPQLVAGIAEGRIQPAKRLCELWAPKAEAWAKRPIPAKATEIEEKATVAPKVAKRTALSASQVVVKQEEEAQEEAPSLPGLDTIELDPQEEQNDEPENEEARTETNGHASVLAEDTAEAGVDYADYPWTGKRLFFAMPILYDVMPATMFAVMALFDRDKMQYSQQNATQITKARNILADRFLKSGCEWSFWLDHDMIPPIGNAAWWKHTCGAPKDYPNEAAGMHIIARLINSGQKFISSLYFGRGINGAGMYAEALENEEVNRQAHRGPKSEIRETRWAAAGCMLVHRDVFEAVIARRPELVPKQTNGLFPFFTPEASYAGLGEDAAFAYKVNQAGYKIYVDHGAICAHVGRYAFGPWDYDRGRLTMSNVGRPEKREIRRQEAIPTVA